MTNPSEPIDEAVGDEVGGMLRFLAFTGGGTNQAPTANNDAVSVVEGFSTGINVLGNDTDPEGDLLSIASYDTTPGLTCDGLAVQGGICTYAAAPASAPATVTFNYSATDGVNMSNAALVTVTITVNPADVPVLYLSTVGAGSVPGVAGPYADTDGLTVAGATYYMSFNRNGGTSVPDVGTVQDEAVVSYDGANWSTYFTGAGQLDGTNSQDVDAIHVP